MNRNLQEAEKETLEKAIGGRLKKLREHYETKLNDDLRKENPNYKHVAVSLVYLSKQLNISRETLGRYESGDQVIKADHLLALAKFYGVSCDQIVTGMPSKYAAIYNKTGLSKDSVEWLTNTSDENKQIIDYIFSHPDIADELYDIFRVYMKLTLPQFGNFDNGEYGGRISQDYLSEDTLLGYVFADSIQNLLFAIRKSNLLNRYKNYDEDMQKAMAKVDESIKRRRQQKENILRQERIENRD